MSQIQAQRVVNYADRFGEVRGMGLSTLAFKVATQDTNGALFVIEQTMHAQGGPPRHIHLEQDEWFYVVEGEFVAQVGDERFQLGPGDSLFAPRQIPHVWAFVGEQRGRLVVAFTPAGKMEGFFRETTKTNAMPTQDPALWLAHGMQVVGPPLQVK
jgi:quercetin dioxygenase-like cupin family protein